MYMWMVGLESSSQFSVNFIFQKRLQTSELSGRLNSSPIRRYQPRKGEMVVFPLPNTLNLFKTKI